MKPPPTHPTPPSLARLFSLSRFLSRARAPSLSHLSYVTTRARARARSYGYAFAVFFLSDEAYLHISRISRYIRISRARSYGYAFGVFFLGLVLEVVVNNKAAKEVTFSPLLLLS